MSGFTIREATTGDTAALVALGRRTFCDNFAHLYTPENLERFLHSAYTAEQQEQDIRDPRKRVMVVEHEGELVGYASSAPCKLPVADMPENAYELQRIYLLPVCKGQGVGTRLLQDAFDFYRRQQASAVYVGVWSQNYPAQAFYHKFGFEKVGEYLFMVGDHADDEWIMRHSGW